MFSNELASKLIKLPKSMVSGTAIINLSADQTRFTLRNLNEPEYEFLLEIKSNRKITFKISFHNQENNSKEGLIRIDYKGGHKNPESITDYVPEIAKPYVGYFFQNESQIHLFVEGFRDLAWAVPLKEYNFPVLDINNTDDFSNAISAFAKEINLVSPFTIQNSIL